MDELKKLQFWIFSDESFDSITFQAIPSLQMFCMGFLPDVHPQDASPFRQFTSDALSSSGFVPSDNIESLQLFPFFRTKGRICRTRGQTSSGNSFRFLFFSVKNGQCEKKKLKCLSPSRLTAAIQAKASARHWPGGVGFMSCWCLVVAVGRYVHGGVSLLRAAVYRRLLLVSLSLCDPSFDCKQGAQMKNGPVSVVDVTPY